MSEQNYPSYLIHYGIEGQKWGVRRFQNEDGTYTDEGNLRRRDQKHFVKTQAKLGRKFDKYTEKIKQDQAAGKRISNRRVEKAAQLGTKHRALDFISKNPQPYLKARGLDRASRIKRDVKIGAGAANLAAGNAAAYYYEYPIAAAHLSSGAVSIASGVTERKLEKMFINKWMQRQYGDAIKKSRNLTLKDLEKHGIKRRKNNKTQYEIDRKANERSIKKLL